MKTCYNSNEYHQLVLIFVSALAGKDTPLVKTEKIEDDLPKVSPDEKKWVEQQRDNFLAMVTHDFKSPLTVIMGYAELIATHEGLDSSISEMCGYILKNGEKLLGMVDDFTFHAKLQSGALTPEFAPTDLNAVLKEVRKEFSVQAAKKQSVNRHGACGRPAICFSG